jgi:Family of unknown function (DUF6069)
MTATLPSMLEQIASLVRLDFAPRHEQPAWWRVVLATIAAIAGSLIADALLVAVGEHVLHVPATYQHFRLSDYGKLTVVGVIIACVAWPITTRITAEPRWMFFRMAILVTLVLWLPDLYILYKGQSAKAVGVLMVMHLAIAVVTYNLLVRVAPVRPDRDAPRRAPAHGDGRDHSRRNDDRDYYDPRDYRYDTRDYRDDEFAAFYRRRDEPDGYRGGYDDLADDYHDRPGESFGHRGDGYDRPDERYGLRGERNDRSSQY